MLNKKVFTGRNFGDCLLRGTEQFQRPVCHLLDDLKMGHLGTHYPRPQWPLIESHPGEC